MRRPALSLLIIDDNPGSLEMLSSALAQPDLEILTASDPEDGVDLVHEQSSSDRARRTWSCPHDRASRCWIVSWRSIRPRK